MPIFILILFLAIVTQPALADTFIIQKNGVNYECNPTSKPSLVEPNNLISDSVNDGWDCSTEQKDRTGMLNDFGCKLPTPWACVATKVDTCVQKTTGQRRSASKKEFLNKCSEGLGDCF